MPNAMGVTTNGLLNYSGHSGAEIELSNQKSKIVSQNRKIILREKLMPISVMTGPNKPEKCDCFLRTEIFHFIVAVLLF